MILFRENSEIKRAKHQLWSPAACCQPSSYMIYLHVKSGSENSFCVKPVRLAPRTGKWHLCKKKRPATVSQQGPGGRRASEKAKRGRALHFLSEQLT